MARTVGIGIQDFEKIIRRKVFYVDKTMFIKQWWESMDDVTLIARPRRFGKTLTMSTVEKFFSTEYAGTDLFSETRIWQEADYRKLQGTYPVISLSFSDVKERSYSEAKKKLCKKLQLLYFRYGFLREGELLNEEEKQLFSRVSPHMEEYEASMLLQQLTDYLYRYYKKKVIILLDEYDTPMQEAYVGGYWEEMTEFIRSLFNATFKNNPHLERALLTGITGLSKESIFSDLNNLEVVTTTSPKYEDAFGFTEEEVFSALEEYDLSGEKEEVKRWYDGFTFGEKEDIYNPWSIINYLDERQCGPYWANTSSNRLAGKVIQEGTVQIKERFGDLLAGGSVFSEIDEQIVYNQLDLDESAIWSLLLASGYLKVKGRSAREGEFGQWKQVYELALTNFEVQVMFRKLVRGWFASASSNYNGFIKALLQDDQKGMNGYMNRVAQATFSLFDTGGGASESAEPERFYHGFVLGMMVELDERYIITSNRESGFGRYDVVLEPRRKEDDAMILEFKVREPESEKSLSDTAAAALAQIEERGYALDLAARGIPESRIRKYGFAFQGKKVLIEKGE